MDLSGLTIFQQMESKMHWLSTRQTVLSQNIANADTPGYKPQDLKAFGFTKHLELAEALPMEVTTPGHIASGSTTGAPKLINGEVVETSPDGNKVSLEDQMTKVADTGMDYQMLTNLYRKQLGMIKTALGRGSTA